MAGEEDGKDQGTGVLFRAKIRTSGGRSATTPVAVMIDAKRSAEKENAEPVLYRFKVRSPDGGEITSTVVVAGRKRKLEVSNLRWGSMHNRHGGETTLHASLDSHDGGPLQFLVELSHGKSWRQYATLPATVKNGEAAATLSLQHPAFSLESVGAPENAGSARLRFKVEKVPNEPKVNGGQDVRVIVGPGARPKTKC